MHWTIAVGFTYFESCLLASDLKEVGSRAHDCFVHVECFTTGADLQICKVLIVEQADSYH